MAVDCHKRPSPQAGEAYVQGQLVKEEAWEEGLMPFVSYKHIWGLQQWRNLAMTEFPAKTQTEKDSSVLGEGHG